ncbi:hypothetical protein [Gottfriedia acidiceleris]|uniref:Uncharacterized protein n=1 Tax=Gottfriedia acidiceleris TaxID=371036 RepID=A0ABY4JTQ9_9BACI|nr:hypothetical protein [Gottfriedia acidiceleris]UPM56213.1 hypothetical protein MY490_10425 [Gottfriedia acidiceleris]
MKKIKEDEHFYNNKYILNNDILEFERVYMVDEYKFDKESYEKLSKIYEQLPSYMGNPTTFP